MASLQTLKKEGKKQTEKLKDEKGEIQYQEEQNPKK